MNLDYRSVPYRILENGIRILSIIAFSIFFSTGGGGGGNPFDVLSLAAILFVGIGLSLAWEVAYVRRYEYYITPDTFDIASGVISRREREIPFERIQNVDIAQNVLQRFLGIAEVRLETAGGGQTEAQLQYVSRSEAERIQNVVSQRKRGESPAPDDAQQADSPDVLFELGRRELLVLGLTSTNFRLLGWIAVLFSFVGSPVAAQQISPSLGTLVLVTGPAIAAAALVILWVVSGLQAVLRQYGFRLVRQDDELRYQRGLFQKYNGTIPLSKVQTVMIRENVLARLVGYGNLVIETAGYAPGQSSDVQSAVPIARRDKLFELARQVEDVGDVSFQRAPERARTRYVARYTIVIAVLVGILGGVHLLTDSLPYWYAAGAVWPLTLPAAHLKWTHIGYHVGENYVVARSGFWTRRTTIVPYYRVQTVADSQTVFQRRRNLGTLVVDTASSGGLWGGDAIVPDIDAEDARRLRGVVHDRFKSSLARRKREREGTRQTVSKSPDRTGNPDPV